eukprot:m.333638 g.333638  ORF g.333638 m.333638 type:complete len:326 (+) comp17186_c0_seq1:21-998(+)
MTNGLSVYSSSNSGLNLNGLGGSTTVGAASSASIAVISIISSGSSGLELENMTTPLRIGPVRTEWYRFSSEKVTSGNCPVTTLAGLDNISNSGSGSELFSFSFSGFSSVFFSSSFSLSVFPLSDFSSSVLDFSLAFTLEVIERTAVSTFSFDFSLGGSVWGGYANRDGGAFDFMLIFFTIFRSELRQTKAVGVRARDKQFPRGNQNQNCVNKSIPVTDCIRIWPSSFTNRAVTLRPPLSKIPWAYIAPNLERTSSCLSPIVFINCSRNHFAFGLLNGCCIMMSAMAIKAPWRTYPTESCIRGSTKEIASAFAVPAQAIPSAIQDP